jgi:hypothetical protein
MTFHMSSSDWTHWLSRWTAAGLVDGVTADRIRAFEAVHAGSNRLRWPIVIALAFGALMIGGGILLFVAANWDALPSSSRFALVLLLVSIFHVSGAAVAERFRGMSEALHAIGTVALGAGIALSGQVFHLDEHWPGGIMLWALGAAIGWVVLRHTSQLALSALLVPAWLISEWIAATEGTSIVRAGAVPAAGALLLSLSYLAAAGPGPPTRTRRALVWMGAVMLAIAAPVLAAIAGDWVYTGRAALDVTSTIGWTIAFAGSLVLAAVLRRADAWPSAVAALWVAALVFVPALSRGVSAFAWWALGAIGLVAWGVRDARVERINLGAAFFAATVLVFYFSRVMDKLGRSASLLTLGLLFLVGGWVLERMRRGLVARSREGA